MELFSEVMRNCKSLTDAKYKLKPFFEKVFLYATLTIRTSCKLTVNINCTVLGVVSNVIHSDALIYS